MSDHLHAHAVYCSVCGQRLTAEHRRKDGYHPEGVYVFPHVCVEGSRRPPHIQLMRDPELET